MLLQNTELPRFFPQNFVFSQKLGGRLVQAQLLLELQDLQVDSRLHVLGIKWAGAYRVLDRLFGLVENISELANADMDEHLHGSFISVIDASQQLKHLAQYR